MPLAAQQEVETGGGPGILAATDDTLWIELHRASHLARLDPETMTVELLTDVPAHCFISAADGVVWTTIHRENLVHAHRRGNGCHRADRDTARLRLKGDR